MVNNHEKKLFIKETLKNDKLSVPLFDILVGTYVYKKLPLMFHLT